MRMITRAFSRLLQVWRSRHPTAARVVVTRPVWFELIQELGRRGLEGKRESGAFLLTPRDGDGRTVTQIAYLDDLDPTCLVGSIHFHAHGYSRLWSLCEREGVRVLADVHTHPGNWVCQSEIDRDNPMVALRGHLALIVPDYATRPVEAEEIGIHEYRGDAGWFTWLGTDAAKLIEISERP